MARSPLCNKKYILQETPYLHNLRLALEQALDRPVTYHNRLRHLLMLTCLEQLTLPITLVSYSYCSRLTLWTRVLFLEADSFSASQKIFHNLCNFEVNLQCSPERTTWSILIQFMSSHPVYLRSILIYTPIYAYVSQVISFFRISQAKMCMHLSTLPFVLHTSPI